MAMPYFKVPSSHYYRTIQKNCGKPQNNGYPDHNLNPYIHYMKPLHSKL